MKYLVLDVGGTAIKASLTNPAGEMFEISETPSDGHLGGQVLCDRMVEVIGLYQGYDRIGISTTGQVDSQVGQIIFANENVPNYTGMRIGQFLSDRFGVPVRVENDVNAAAIGEAYYGSAVGQRDFLCITFGTGIGGAIVIDGHLYKGCAGVAAEFGHIVTHAGGLPCACGQVGCYEQYASTSALIREAIHYNPNWLNGRLICAARDSGELRIMDLLNQWTDEVVIGLASLVHIFNPSLLVLGGGIISDTDIFQRIKQRVASRVMSSFRMLEIVPAKLGNQAGLLGMTQLCKEMPIINQHGGKTNAKQ